jgi:benzoyl-CoA reductase/2-hydroxyglutaryl-CoA dehydratase subunit BcrC/BadD/HgdB
MTIETELQKLRHEGRRLIGCFPLYPPLELFHSLGLTPVVLWGFGGSSMNLGKADLHLQPFACAIARHLAEFILSGKGSCLDGLFMYNACDTLRNLPEILLSGLKEQGRSLPLVRVHIPQVPPGQTSWGDYFRTRIAALIRDLEEAFGVVYSSGSFRRSVALYNRMRSLCLTLEGLAAEGKISYGLFSRTVQEGGFRPVEEQIRTLEQIVAENETGQPGRDGQAVPVLISGILPPSPTRIRIMEEAGLRVAGNDVASQRRSYATQALEFAEPDLYYQAFYENHVPCPTLLYTADRRLEYLHGLIGQRAARGLIFLGEKFCEYEYFEFPYLERKMQEQGVAVAAFEIAGEEEHQSSFATRIQAFAEMFREQDDHHK